MPQHTPISDLDISQFGDHKRLTPPETSRAGYGSESTLAKKRMEGRLPRYIKDGKRIYYLVGDLRAYDEECRRTSTLDAAA